MKIECSVDDFILWIGQLLRCEHIEHEGVITYSMKNRGRDLELILPKRTLEDEVEILKDYEEVDGTTIATAVSYECLVRASRPFVYSAPGEKIPLEIEDAENKIRYSLYCPSLSYSLFVIYKAGKMGEARSLFRPFFSRRLIEDAIDNKLDLLEVLKAVPRGSETLRIEAEEKKKIVHFKKFSASLLFDLSYNLDAAFVQQTDFSELLRSGRISRLRRGGIKDLAAPRRAYIPDLIYHYQLAVATESPLLEYLSYYHVAEHFFVSIYFDKLVQDVQDRITHPNFSYKRSNDIARLIKKISSSIEHKSNITSIKEEKEALKLTLDRFIDLEILRDDLNNFDSGYIDYYKNNKVGFSGGDNVDLDDKNIGTVYSKLASRVYKTRNALVHSKELSQSKYTPFRDDKHLAKEVPLIKFIAEQIIIATSNIMQ